MANTIAIDVFGDILMSRARMDKRAWVFLSRLAQVKGAVSIPKSLFLEYCTKAPLIQLTRLVPLGVWPKSDVFTGVVVEKT